jgi:hypothetical protein
MFLWSLHGSILYHNYKLDQDHRHSVSCLTTLPCPTSLRHLDDYLLHTCAFSPSPAYKLKLLLLESEQWMGISLSFQVTRTVWACLARVHFDISFVFTSQPCSGSYKLEQCALATDKYPDRSVILQVRTAVAAVPP